VAADATGAWVAEAAMGGAGQGLDGRIVRLDAASGRIVMELEAGGPVADLVVSDGVLWVARRDPPALLAVC
jgi:hypothetical protein